MLKLKVLTTVGLLVLATSPVFAGAFFGPPRHRGPTNGGTTPVVTAPGTGGGTTNPGSGSGSGSGPGSGEGSGGQLVGAPGPIAGVGLPIIVAAGGLIWYRRQRNKRQS